MPCAPGTYSNADIKSDGSCEMHMLMDGVGCVHTKEKCEKCPVGQYQDDYSATMCKDCPMGYASGPCTQCRQQGWDGKLT